MQIMCVINPNIKNLLFGKNLNLISIYYIVRLAENTQKKNSKLSSVISNSMVTCMSKENNECLKKDFEKALKEGGIK